MTAPRRRIVAPALVAGFFLTGCAVDQGAPLVTEQSRSCAGPRWKWGNYRAHLERNIPSIAWIELSADDRARALDRLNASGESLTGFAYDRIGFFRRGERQPVLLVFIVGDCVWVDLMTSETVVRQMAAPPGRGA